MQWSSALLLSLQMFFGRVLFLYHAAWALDIPWGYKTSRAIMWVLCVIVQKTFTGTIVCSIIMIIREGGNEDCQRNSSRPARPRFQSLDWTPCTPAQYRPYRGMHNIGHSYYTVYFVSSREWPWRQRVDVSGHGRSRGETKYSSHLAGYL